jgi:hypothetical protein
MASHSSQPSQGPASISSPETMQEHLQTAEVSGHLQTELAKIYQAIHALTQEVRALRRDVNQPQNPPTQP